MAEQVKNGLKKVVNLEDIFMEGKGLSDIDYDNVELVSGQTPEDIEEKCLNVCKDYLSKNWTQQTIDTIEVKRISGGLLNQMFYCGIKEPDNSENVPQEVAIKLYGDFRPNRDLDDRSKVEEIAISLLFSEIGIGPKIYGQFEGGQILKFYKQRPFSGADKKDPKLIEKVFRTLARIHSLKFPVKNRAHQILDKLEELYEIEKDNSDRHIEEYNLDTYKKNDVKSEINWIKGVVKRVNSPIVFCHLDYRSDNLLITEPNDELIVCDFDLSSYHYRGYDFVMSMMEWSKKHFMQSFTSIEGLPLGDELRPHIEIYVDECQRIDKSFSDNENNSVDHILKEAKVSLLFQYLSFATPRPPQDVKHVSKSMKVILKIGENLNIITLPLADEP